MRYVIISPDRIEPWACLELDHPPTPETMADAVADIHGYPSRDEWADDNGHPFIGFAPVH